MLPLHHPRNVTTVVVRGAQGRCNGDPRWGTHAYARSLDGHPHCEAFGRRLVASPLVMGSLIKKRRKRMRKKKHKKLLKKTRWQRRQQGK